jgi:hypothetical protein
MRCTTLANVRDIAAGTEFIWRLEPVVTKSDSFVHLVYVCVSAGGNLAWPYQSPGRKGLSGIPKPLGLAGYSTVQAMLAREGKDQASVFVVNYPCSHIGTLKYSTVYGKMSIGWP